MCGPTLPNCQLQPASGGAWVTPWIMPGLGEEALKGFRDDVSHLCAIFRAGFPAGKKGVMRSQQLS